MKSDEKTYFTAMLQREVHRRQLQQDQYLWHKQARPNQLPPPGDWRIWLILAGRGFGKTRTGAETLRLWVNQARAKRIALIAKSIYEARAVMVEGPSGLLSVYPPQQGPLFSPSKRQILWPCGAIATLYGAEQYEQLRGPQFDTAWIDEFAKFRQQKALWEQLLLSLRLGQDPRCLITTTPRPSKMLEALLKDPAVVVTKGTTFENQTNLAPAFFDSIIAQFSGTQLGAQELYAEVLTERDGALWQRALLRYAQPESDATGQWQLDRIVIAIDPATTHTQDSDETGIVIAGLDAQKRAFVLEDLSGRLSPADWGRRVVEAYWRYKADRIVAEVNKGGDLVERVVKSMDNTVSYKAVRATRGKATRAEPIAALYEQERVFHVRPFTLLETQLCTYVQGSTSRSPDRLDALVWALTELFLEAENRPILKIWGETN
jgi:predicted phage terminase large subunit-like protein